MLAHAAFPSNPVEKHTMSVYSVDTHASIPDSPIRDLAAEEAVISIILQAERRGWDADVAYGLPLDAFSDATFRDAFATAKRLRANNRPVTIGAVDEELSEYLRLPASEYLPILKRLSPLADADSGRALFSAAGLPKYVDRLQELAERRRIADVARQVLADVAGGAPTGYLRASLADRLAPSDRPSDARLEDTTDIWDECPELNPPIVDGLFRKNEVTNIVAPTKIGKSWLAYGLAFSVAIGRRWLDRFDVAQGRVLIVDNELHRPTIADRHKAVAAAMGVSRDDIRGNLSVLSLRGKMTDLHGIGRLLSKVRHGDYSLVILDALYRAIPSGTSENDNAQMMELFNLMDAYADRLGAAWVNVHHSTKGLQTDKRVTDIGSGAGSQSRAADCHLVLREHAESDVLVLDGATRSFRPIEPLPLRWGWPLFEIAQGVDPSELKRAPTRGESRQADKDREGRDSVMAALDSEPMTRRQLRREIGMGPDRINRIVRQLIDGGCVEEAEDGKIFAIGGALL